MLLMPASRANKTNKIPSCMHNMILISILFRILHFNESLLGCMRNCGKVGGELLAWKNIIILILRFLQNEERRSIDERCIMESTIRRGWRRWFALIRSVVVFVGFLCSANSFVHRGKIVSIFAAQPNRAGA